MEQDGLAAEPLDSGFRRNDGGWAAISQLFHSLLMMNAGRFGACQGEKPMSVAAIGLAVALLNSPVVHSTVNEPVFEVSPCKQGYEWNDKKKKCVRKGLDY